MSTQKTVRQQAGAFEESEVLRLEENKVEQIVDALNTDLANAYVLYHQIHKHHWNVEGAESLDTPQFLQEAYEQLEEGADRIAERAQAIGGVPVAGPANQEERATIEFEGEDVYDIRTSLANDMDAYGDMIQEMREHVQLAANLGDPTTEHILKEVLTELEEDAHHVEH